MGASTQQQFKSGSWTKEEDDRLRKAQAQYGNQWVKIAKHVKTRSKQQCAQRWRHAAINPNIYKQRWAEEEDHVLLALAKEMGACWAAIAQRMPGRSDQQCRGRWLRLHRRTTKEPQAKCQHSSKQETGNLLEIGSGSGDASDTVIEDTNQECKSDDCQVEEDCEEPDVGSCSKKRCNTMKMEADNCDADMHVDKDNVQEVQPCNMLTQLDSIDSDHEMTVSECAKVLMDLKQSQWSGAPVAGTVRARLQYNLYATPNHPGCYPAQYYSNAFMPPYLQHQPLAPPRQSNLMLSTPATATQHETHTPVQQRNHPVRVHTEAMQECAATYGFWVNQDRYREGQDARPLFRRCDNTYKDSDDQTPVEAYQLWDHPPVAAKVILDMWKYLKLGEPITIDGKVVPSGTLFNKVMKKLKKLKELKESQDTAP